jgi:hypothetical protein
MKLVDIACGHIVLKFEEKTLTIYGEELLREHGLPDFVVYSNSIESWDFPDNKEKISEKIKDKLFDFCGKSF